MQVNKEKTLQIIEALACVIKKIRVDKKNLSINKLANEYDLNKSTISKIEKGDKNCKIITLWQLANALDLKFSDFILLVEEQLGEDFTLIDE